MRSPIRQKVLLCCDLDRTLLPNGQQPESNQARQIFKALISRDEIDLAYVSGRDVMLIKQAIADYDIPIPAYAIGDVGTSMYEIGIDGYWHPMQEWRDEIARDWQEITSQYLLKLLGEIPGIVLQEPQKQSEYKTSFYFPFETSYEFLSKQVDQRLAAVSETLNTVWSLDEIDHIGLLDILPSKANKRHAIEFLMSLRNYEKSRTIFAGDSGNDIAVLTSGLQSVLVANADVSVRDNVIRWQQQNPAQKSLYLARGRFLNMNGNYSAGILEGVAHFLPETLAWMSDTCS